MLKSLLRIGVRCLRRRLDALVFLNYRVRMCRAGVNIAKGARIFGLSGITIGKGTAVYDGATIAATELRIGDRPGVPNRGTIVIGERCSILPGALIASSGARVELGNNVSLNPYAIIYGYGNVSIGDDVRIAAHVVVVASSHRFSDPNVPIDAQGLTGKGVEIGPDVWIGTGAKILDGVRVGRGAVVGAGAVVTGDVAPYDVVAGVPARKIRSRLDSNA
jgi:acetyltransferase-like isoleucine patch superfamily enzyme